MKRVKSHNPLDYIGKPQVWLVIILRILAAGYIFINPLWGLIISWFLDTFDAPIYLHIVGMPVSVYEDIDKITDWFYYTSILLVGLRYGIFSVLLIFFIFKLAGQIIFMRTKNSKIFVLFPNFLEPIFVWLIILGLLGIRATWIWLAGLLLIKELQEIYIHILFPNYVRKNGFPHIYRFFGIKKEVFW